MASFHITEMDCLSEENLIRMKHGNIDQITQLSFDLSNKELCVHHALDNSEIVSALDSLNLGSKLTETSETDD